MAAFLQEPMRLFGPFHLAWCILGVPTAIGLAYIFAIWSAKDSSHKVKCCKAILLCSWIVFSLLELWKQLSLESFAAVSDRYWYIPFQLCSMPLYCCLPAAYCKMASRRRAFCCFLSCYSLLGGFLTLCYPEDILIRPLPLAVHGFVWHCLMLFIGFYLAFSGYGKVSDKPNRKQNAFSALVGAWIVLLCSAAVALALNLILWEPSGHSINLFYLGPMPSNQPVFCVLYAHNGWLVTMFCYLAVLMLGGGVFCIPYLLINP